MQEGLENYAYKCKHGEDCCGADYIDLSGEEPDYEGKHFPCFNCYMEARMQQKAV